jgi:hypothetical protein
MRLTGYTVASAFALCGCRPDVDEPASHVDAARVLAVKIEPPEAAPGSTVAAHALVASADGTVTDAALDWALCHDPKSPAEDRTVNPACLADAESVASGVQAGFALPMDACAVFGPETPPGNFRPRDPDSTGGYFQPIRLRLDDGDASDSVALERLQCHPRNVSIDTAAAFAKAYVPNRNPSVRAVTATSHGAELRLGSIAPGASVRFELSWAAGDAESFTKLDPDAETLLVEREVLRVSWYATAGSFASDRTGTDEGSENGTRSSNAWSAPADAIPVHFWAVLRDSRGGQDFTAWDAVVTGK